MKNLTESIGSTTGEHATVAAAHVVTIRITGCGLVDEEAFEIADVRAARTAMRKLMATAVRQFGKAEAED